MNIIKQPNCIKFGIDSAKDFKYPNKSLVITSKGAISRGWLNYTNLENQIYFDDVEPNPSSDTAEKIISDFKNKDIDYIIGLGGGSSLDVAKFVAHKLQKKKILIPTTFGSGSEVTRISVLTVNGKKTSFHDDKMFADVAIVDPYFIKNTPQDILKNSAIDACAQCSEGYDSKNGNEYTRFLCQKAFEILEDGILNEKYEKLPMGSLITGLGFGNCSTTLGHALSYVYSNEGYSHGHALAFTTRVAHEFNSSKFTDRFNHIVNKLKFDKIILKQNLEDAANIILKDSKHLMNNPKHVEKKDIISLLEKINNFD
ncbi:iron-containing alcohol dehydrogenase [Candidatus Nitrosopelagicus sp.]|nr:iron-containing alcohol dehydrogenase [Candidatus Nitrosopelagicus sp.]